MCPSLLSPLFTPYTIVFCTRPHLIKVWLWLKITSSCKSIVGLIFKGEDTNQSRQILVGFFYIFVGILWHTMLRLTHIHTRIHILIWTLLKLTKSRYPIFVFSNDAWFGFDLHCLRIYTNYIYRKMYRWNDSRGHFS